jgi:hypothetical protein
MIVDICRHYLMANIHDPVQAAPRLQAGVDGLGLQGQHGEDAFVHAP